MEKTSKLVIVNGDSELILNQLSRSKTKVEKISKKSLKNYKLLKNLSQFTINEKVFNLKFLLPEETSYQLSALIKILEYLNIPLDKTFSKLKLPPGRSSIFKGIKNTTIIDSSYNADLESMRVMLNMFSKIPGKEKWIILGDMISQGKIEQLEHEKLAEIISALKLERIILVGPRLTKFTYPHLKSAVKFEMPLEALDYLRENITGEELLFFKGARFLEGIIEHLLQNKSDIDKLCRREKVWQERRKQWGL